MRRAAGAGRWPAAQAAARPGPRAPAPAGPGRQDPAPPAGRVAARPGWP